MELGFVICVQIVVLAAVSVVPIKVLRQNSEKSRARVIATTQARSHTQTRR